MHRERMSRSGTREETAELQPSSNPSLCSECAWAAATVQAVATAEGPLRRGREGPPLRVLRISHSAVVTGWRQRERLLRTSGVDLTLVTAQRWEEGGAMVAFTPAGDDFAQATATWGHHPNAFLFDPRPLWRLLRRNHFDLVDLHEEPFGLAVIEVVVLMALAARRTPFLVYSAQNIEKRYPPPFRWFERFVLRRAAGAYTCNKEAGEILIGKGLVNEVAFLPLGVDIERFHPVERSAPHGRLRVGFVGRLIPHKGVDVLLRAVAGDPRLEVDVWGDGPERGSLEQLVVQLGIGDRVRFHGHVDDVAVAAAYAEADVLAVPSIPVPGWLEQFGRVVVEAQASGVPVVASASGALPDVVGPAGLLVPPGEPEALRGALVSLLDDPDHWNRLRVDGQTMARNCSWSAVATAQHQLYERVVAAHR